jgi:hypothetical protein
MRVLVVGMLAMLICASAGGAVSVGVTACSVDFHARVSNLDCAIAVLVSK